MTAIKERPILFSAPMVRAILEGRKTVTRRECKPQPSANAHTTCASGNPMGAWWETGKDIIRCPYGKPGDLLWVRESWQADSQVDSVAPRDLSHGEPIRYPADWDFRETGCAMIMPGKIRPSIHMPRWVSRILLEITDVRVERLQDISEEQALAEGIGDHRFTCDRPVEPDGYPACSCGSIGYVDAFSELWNSINGPGAWDANPWVWTITFQRVEP